MPPPPDRRRKTVPDWLVPALLGLIGVLIAMGGGNVVAALHDNAAQTAGLREDMHAWQLQIEARMTRVEDHLGIKEVKK